jgi:endo-1,4-beta-xylanase
MYKECKEKSANHVIRLLNSVFLLISVFILALTGCQDPSGPHSGFKAVTYITGIPYSAYVGNLTLSGTVVPENAAHKDIIWTLREKGVTGAELNGNTLTTKTPGTVKMRAVIKDGEGEGIDYIHDFAIIIISTSPKGGGSGPNVGFIPVTSITGVPTTGTAEIPLTLTGRVVPSNASNKVIVWSVKNAEGTGATISGNSLRTTGSGRVVVTATIANGTDINTDYTQDFTISY